MKWDHFNESAVSCERCVVGKGPAIQKKAQRTSVNLGGVTTAYRVRADRLGFSKNL